MFQLREQCSWVTTKLRPPSLSPWLIPSLYSKQRLSPKRTIPCLMIKGTMGFLGGPLGPQIGALQSRMPNKPGDLWARQQQSYRLRTKDLAHFCVSAVVTHQLNTTVSTCVPILGKPEIWNLDITHHPRKGQAVRAGWFLVMVSSG